MSKAKVTLPGSLTEITHFSETNPFPTTTTTHSATPIFVTKFEADCIIEKLQSFPIEQIGSSDFLNMYGYQVTRLNLQAHASAQQEGHDGDEYIVESIVTFQKIPILVQTLLSIEAWRKYVLQGEDDCNDNPSSSSLSSSILANFIAKQGNSLRCAFILHVETTLVSLLTLLMYKKERCRDGLDNDSAISLVDYCARQMASLATPLSTNEIVQFAKKQETAQEITQRIQTRSTLEEIQETRLLTEYKTAVCSVSLARYLSEYLEYLPLGAQTRILDTHDFLMMMVPLIEEPPWTRRRCTSTVVKSSKKNVVVWEKLNDNHEWGEVAPSDLLTITKHEAQCWIAVFYLTCNNTCRERYALNSFRKEQLLRLRKFLNEVMLDQLPFLTDLMQYMDQLSLMYVPESSTGQGSAFLLQQVDTIRNSILKGKDDWAAVAQEQCQNIFGIITDSQDEDLRLIANIYDEDCLGNIIGNKMNHPFEPIASPIESISLVVSSSDNVTLDTFELVAKNDGSDIITTSHGLFKRAKLKILRAAGDSRMVIPKKIHMDATVYFQDLPNYTKKLSTDLNLSSSNNKKGEGNNIQWRQLGSLSSDKIVIQLGFKVCNESDDKDDGENNYILHQAFLSQPTDEK